VLNNTPKRFLVIQERPNPSTDYFVLPYLRDIGGVETVAGMPGVDGGIDARGETTRMDKINASPAQDLVQPSIPMYCLSWAKSEPEQALAPSNFSQKTQVTANPGSKNDDMADLLDGAFVVFVRYVASPWRRLIDQHRSKLAGLAYFFDDDIPDIKAGAGLPWKYRLKLYRYGARHFNWLLSHRADLWVSTPYLQNKYRDHKASQNLRTSHDKVSERNSESNLYAHTNPNKVEENIRGGLLPDSTNTPRLLAPRQLLSRPRKNEQPSEALPLETDNRLRSDTSVEVVVQPEHRRCRVFYHATASHRAEIEWLYPVIEQVLARDPRIEFEIVGDARTRKHYQKLPRTTIMSPMSWVDYQEFLIAPERQQMRLIGLAPHLLTPFNAARSYTKVFDIERAGAVGVLAEEGPWSKAGEVLDLNRHWLVPMDRQSWGESVLRASQLFAVRRDLI